MARFIRRHHWFARFAPPPTPLVRGLWASAIPPQMRQHKAPLPRGLGVKTATLGAFLFAVPAFAANESLLTAPNLPPYQWFASTDPKNQNEDYLLLKPGETRKIPLAAGKLERLWATSSAPEKTILSLENEEPVPLWRNNRALAGQLHEKAFLLYPQAPK